MNNKKAKKSALKNAQANLTNPLDTSDHAALSRRAQRFQREHEIERQKNTGLGNGYKGNNGNSNLFGTRLSSGTGPSWGANDYDDPEADPVWLVSDSAFSAPNDSVQNVPNWDRFTIVGTNPETFKDYLRLTTVR